MEYKIMNAEQPARIRERISFSENSKKGFTLVELIIVIAIMAILVGVVAATVIPYMEKARKAKDQQVLSSITTAALSASTECAGELPSFNKQYSGLENMPSNKQHNIQEFAQKFMGYMNNATAEEIYDKFKSKAFTSLTKDKIYVAYYSGKLDYTTNSEGQLVPNTSGGNPLDAFPNLKAYQCVTYVSPYKDVANKGLTLDKYMEVFSE